VTARVREFNAFLRDYVNLNPGRISDLRTRMSRVNKFLTQSRDLEDLVSGDVIPQGSFAHKTIIRPFSGNDFDADVLVPMNEMDGWPARKYREYLQKALEKSSTYGHMIVLGKRCVKLDYAHDFHIDLVPFITRSDGLSYITHRPKDIFIRTDPVAFTDWFDDCNRTTNGHLVRVVRLLKYLRDRSSIDIPSVVLSALLAQRVRSFDGVNDYGNVATTLTALVSGLNDYLAPLSSKPFVDDRIGQDLADRWTASGFLNLQSQVKTWARQMTAALEADADVSVEKWQAVFGAGFGASESVEKGTLALSAPSPSEFGRLPAPGEQDLTRDHGIPVRLNSSLRVKVVGRISTGTKTGGRMRPLAARGNLAPIGRQLKFDIEGCTVPQPFDVYWKVRNDGEEALRRKSFRGGIVKGGTTIRESTQFAGPHWVQAWIVVSGVAVATSVQEVTILSD